MIMKIKEISGKNEKELKELLLEKKRDLQNLMIDNKQNKLKNTRSIFNTRKEIAQIMTLMKERQLAGSEKSKEKKEEKN